MKTTVLYDKRDYVTHFCKQMERVRIIEVHMKQLVKWEKSMMHDCKATQLDGTATMSIQLFSTEAAGFLIYNVT